MGNDEEYATIQIRELNTLTCEFLLLLVCLDNVYG